MGARRSLVASCLLSAIACRTETLAERLAAPHAPPQVGHAGVMHEIFEKASAAGTIELAPLLARPHLYALGPLADFTGELLVFDGTPFESRRVDGRVVLANERNLKTPLLVWSYVSKWKEVAVPDEARTLAAFESWLPIVAQAQGLDATQPFAFQLIGAAEQATIHIVALPPGMAVTHENHDSTKWHVDLTATPIQALGFHSTEAKGIWTHHDTNVHIHLRATIGGVMGHVEGLTLASGAIVKIAWR